MTTLNSGMSYEDYLEHYGVKGMRWGRRNSRDTGEINVKTSNGQTGKIAFNPKKVTRDADGGITVNSKREVKKMQKQAEAIKVKTMSDEELRKRINRIQMEQQYAKLTGTPAGKSKLERGKDVYKKTMTIIETGNKIYGAYNSPAGKIIREQIGGTETGKKVQAEIAKQLISAGLKKK